MSTPGDNCFVSFFDRRFYHPSMVLIIRDTLDSTPPPTHNSTPGDNIFKGQIVITGGVCFLPCYTVNLRLDTFSYEDYWRYVYNTQSKIGLLGLRITPVPYYSERKYKERLGVNINTKRSLYLRPERYLFLGRDWLLPGNRAQPRIRTVTNGPLFGPLFRPTFGPVWHYRYYMFPRDSPLKSQVLGWLRHPFV